jgi:hypothetical protein
MCDWSYETPLAELLDDPVVELVMKSDGVERGSLERLLETVECGRLRVAPADCEVGNG